MKLTKSFEQGVGIMTIIATQPNGESVSSRTLQRLLNSSMTYSQKILRKLVVAGLIQSVSGNNGGFTLAKPVNQITVLDVVIALEGKVNSYPNSGLINSIFGHYSCGQLGADVMGEADESIHRIFTAADQVWCQVLSSITLSDIIHRVAATNANKIEINWNNIQ